MESCTSYYEKPRYLTLMSSLSPMLELVIICCNTLLNRLLTNTNVLYWDADKVFDEFYICTRPLAVSIYIFRDQVLFGNLLQPGGHRKNDILQSA